MSGHRLFARYAYPPNELGYCGPADPREVLGFVDGQGDTDLLESTVRCFEGTWPYFEFIAAKHGLEPLDPEVIESYWLGGEMTAALDVSTQGQTLLDALAGAGGSWAHSPDTLLAGMDPDHNFHVFAVYPWLGLLSKNISDQPRMVLDRCRIRWGTVVEVYDTEAAVLSRRLSWDGTVLNLEEAAEETAVVSRGEVQLVDKVTPGDTVALHWDWICDHLSTDQLSHLRASTTRHIGIANERLAQGLV